MFRKRVYSTLALMLALTLMPNSGTFSAPNIAPNTNNSGAVQQKQAPSLESEADSAVNSAVNSGAGSPARSPKESEELPVNGTTLSTRVIVRLAPGTKAEAVAAHTGARVLRQGPLNYATLQIPSNLDPQQALTELKRLPGVETAAPSRLYKAGAAGARLKSLPDSGFPTAAKVSASSLGSVTDEGYKEQWGLDKTGVPKAWELGATGQGITIAVIDTGVDIYHPDLKDKIVPGYNAITGSTDLKSVRDNNGHGTHVAGIAAAARNGEGVVGVAYDAKIMPIKAMDRSGEGTDDVIADGIVWAADHGAKIINLSLGSDAQEEILKEAIAYARAQGSLIVAAAGNLQGDGSGTAGIDYPAADPDVIAVTATDQNDKLAAFSKTGPQAVLAAPGVNILSDYWSAGRSGYAYSDGTSMAAPMVAGAAALVWSQHPDWSADQVRAVLENSAEDLGTSGRDEAYGYGRLNADWAVRFAAEPVKAPAPAALNWAGGIVQDSAATPGAELTVEPRTFGTAGQSVTLVLNHVEAPADFPAPITAGSPAFSVQWGEESPRKMLTLTIKAGPKPVTNGLLGYLYRWSGSRWIQVGGGSSPASVTAGIYEPGIYRLGCVPPPASNRIAGPDRIETAIAIAQAAFPTGADTVILARADDFPDALAGAPLAYKYHAPILLTDTQALREDVYAAIKSLAPRQIMLLGGEGAISGDIATQLGSLAAVERFGGADRYATAAAIARAVGTSGRAAIVNGGNFPDAISIAGIAARQGMPVLLTPGDSLNSETGQWLRQYAVTGTIVVGGEGVLSPALLDQLPDPRRLSGLDRYGTAAAVLQAYQPGGQTVYAATGEDFPDALTGGVLAAGQGTDIILVPPGGPTKEQRAVLTGWQGKRAYALGGSGALSDSALLALQELVQ